MKQKRNMMLIIEPKRDAVLMFPKNGSTLELEEAQNIVGGYIEVVGVYGSHILIVNENGKIDGLEYNPTATAIAVGAGAIGKNDCIVGRAILCPSEMLP